MCTCVCWMCKSVCGCVFVRVDSDVGVWMIVCGFASDDAWMCVLWFAVDCVAMWCWCGVVWCDADMWWYAR